MPPTPEYITLMQQQQAQNAGKFQFQPFQPAQASAVPSAPASPSIPFVPLTGQGPPTVWPPSGSPYLPVSYVPGQGPPAQYGPPGGSGQYLPLITAQWQPQQVQQAPNIPNPYAPYQTLTPWAQQVYGFGPPAAGPFTPTPEFAGQLGTYLQNMAGMQAPTDQQAGQGQAGGAGGGGGGQYSQAPQGINQQWWNEFQEQHQGQTPTQYYGQQGEGLAEALDDLAWSIQFEQQNGHPPTELDWEVHWYQVHAPSAPWAPQNIPGGGGGGQEPEEEQPPLYQPPMIIWR